MKWDKPLLKGKLVKRYKRFFADVEIDGKIITAHCPNTGSLKSCLFEGGDCYVTFNDNPERKLKHTLEATISPDGTWIGVNTMRPNQIVKEMLSLGGNKAWKKYAHFRGEVAISKETRFDFGLNFEAPPEEVKATKKKTVKKTFATYDHYIEVKNVTLREGDGALFPDTESTRAQKHVKEMMDLIAEGKTAEVVFTVQRDDVKWFSPAAHLDPKYAELLFKAQTKGLVISPYLVKIDQDGIGLTLKKLPLKK